ncbi:response regulator [Brachybacterium faecium]|nr:response regulator [Brachybacterium faecium]
MNAIKSVGGTTVNNILLVEDEKNLARFVELELKHENYNVTIAHDGREGLELALEGEWDAILLDLMLPSLNGIEICRRIRQQEQQTPIIMLTARDSVIDRVSGLDHGADDYIVKPFAIEELLARLRSLLRRVENAEPAQKQTKLSYRDLNVEKESRMVLVGEEVIELTKREYDLLLTLMENINIVLTREVLLNKVWGYETEVETNVVDVYVRYLRNKIDRPGEESYIQTVRGTGYVMRT